MLIKLTTLLRPECKHQDMKRLAKWLDLDDAETMTKEELAAELFNEINAPSEIASAWMKPGSWRQ